jgi:His-Xaa-Ser system protein HxsD
VETTLVVSVSECTPEAIRAIAHRHINEVQMSWANLEGQGWQIRLRPLCSAVDLERLCSDFKRELLDQQVRLDLERRTGKLRDLIYQAAFEPPVERRGWWRR